MKKILLTALIAVFALAVNAQSTNTTTKTITTADTVTHTSIGSNVRGFQYTYTETSGTTAGKVYFEGTINGTWVLLDSLTLSDVATAQTKVITVAPTAGTVYKSYRWRNTNTSSATGAVVVTYLRRNDDKAPAPAPLPEALPMAVRMWKPVNQYIR